MKSILLLYLISTALAYSDSTLEDWSEGAVKVRTVSMSDSLQFTFSEIEKRASEELQALAGFNVVLVRFTCCGQELLQGKLSDSNYQAWRSGYDKQSSQMIQAAELVAVGRNAILRVRDETGKVTKKVLSGVDPLELKIRGHSYSIVHISLGNPAVSFPQAHIYLKTDGVPDVTDAKELLNQFDNLFPGLTATVFIRNDEWFIFEQSYPFVNPFSLQGTPPTYSEYMTRKTLRCGHRGDLIACN